MHDVNSRKMPILRGTKTVAALYNKIDVEKKV